MIVSQEGTYDPYPEMQGFQRKTVGNVKSREHAINSLLDDFEPDLYSEYMDQSKLIPFILWK